MSCPEDTNTKNKGLPKKSFIFGAGNVTRTRDLLITNELLYQLSYSSRCYLQRVLYIIVCNFSRGKTEIQNAKFKMQNFGETSFPIIK